MQMHSCILVFLHIFGIIHIKIHGHSKPITSHVVDHHLDSQSHMEQMLDHLSVSLMTAPYPLPFDPLHQ
eukprot:c41295_g1_i1 orf=3-206(-)